jgi:hypothetical protein
MEERPPPGLFLDPSEYRRLNFRFGDRRLAAVTDLVAAGKVSLLSTDVAVLELKRLISREVAGALESLSTSKVAILKSVEDERLDVIRTLPDPAELSNRLATQLDSYPAHTSCVLLTASDVNPMEIFADYFNDRPPFDGLKKKNEFPDAFTLRRLLNWSREHSRTVYVIGPDPDLKRFCDGADGLEYLEKLEILIDQINQENVLVARMMEFLDAIKEQIGQFVQDNFTDLEFRLKFNPHGEVSAVTVQSVEVREVYALQVTDGSVRAEADVTVEFTADFSYDDFDTATYDREDDTWFFIKTIEGETEDRVTVSVVFYVDMEEDGPPEVLDFQWVEPTVVVKEEDRGDYDQYK